MTDSAEQEQNDPGQDADVVTVTSAVYHRLRAESALLASLMRHGVAAEWSGWDRAVSDAEGHGAAEQDPKRHLGVCRMEVNHGSGLAYTVEVDSSDYAGTDVTPGPDGAGRAVARVAEAMATLLGPEALAQFRVDMEWMVGDR